MKVLSLFDGMSCGQLALDRLGVKVQTYYASEIDKYAIEITQKNFPNTIQVGDVSTLDPKDFSDIDLLIFGSPCQGFSFAGKQLAFDDPRSSLFFEAIRLLKAIKPKYFLAENVRMKKEFLEIFTEQVSSCYSADDVASEYKDMFGQVRFDPHLINSSLLSAQSRQRYYWTNILGIKQPKDKGIVLKDILEQDSDEIYQISEAKKCRVLNAKVPQKPIKVGMNVEEVKVRKNQVNISGLQDLLRKTKKKSGKTNNQIAKETNTPTTKVEHWFRTDSSFAIPSDDIWHKLKEVLNIQDTDFDDQIMEFVYRDGVYETKQRVYSDEGKSPTLTASNKDQFIETKPQQIGTAIDVNGHDILKRVYSDKGKSPTLTCGGGNREPKVMVDSYREVRTEEAKKARKKHRQKTEKDYIPFRLKELIPRDCGKVGTINPELNQNHKISLTKDKNQQVYWRKLTPLECERLQTVPDNYTECVSKTQRYKMLGNGWTVDVIAHILKNMDLKKN